MLNYSEKRVLHESDLRQLCISKNWYNNGSIADYNNILQYASKQENITTLHIVTIAKNIQEHTILGAGYDVYSEREILENICFHIFRTCNTFLV